MRQLYNRTYHNELSHSHFSRHFFIAIHDYRSKSISRISPLSPTLQIWEGIDTDQILAAGLRFLTSMPRVLLETLLNDNVFAVQHDTSHPRYAQIYKELRLLEEKATRLPVIYVLAVVDKFRQAASAEEEFSVFEAMKNYLMFDRTRREELVEDVLNIDGEYDPVARAAYRDALLEEKSNPRYTKSEPSIDV